MLVWTFFWANIIFALMFVKIDMGIALVNLACAITCAIHISTKPDPNKEEK